MIGQYVIGLTLVVNIAMRWPSLIPAALIVAVATSLYGERPSAEGLGMQRRAAAIEWQATRGKVEAHSVLTEVSATVPATRSLQVEATQPVPN